MLSQEENEVLCRVGPSTPMGGLLRRYWIPALVSEDLPRSDGDPVRLTLLGENFVAFRDSRGRVGILDEACMHRGASLALGRVENCGITCIYHGWRYAADGTILETPNAPDSAFLGKLKAPTYPVEEVDGVIWVYLGPKGTQPPVPVLPYSGVPEAQRTCIYTSLDCNWVQVLENTQDPSHLGILHAADEFVVSDSPHDVTATTASSMARAARDQSPAFEILDTPYGFYYAGFWKAPDPDKRFVRVFSYLVPFIIILPQTGKTVLNVPLDDYRTRTMVVYFEREGTVNRERIIAQQYGGMERHFDRRNSSSSANLGHIRMYAEDRWLQNRAAMATTWTGISGVFMQDAATLLSMGPIAQRHREHLVPADSVAIRMRRWLLRAARDLQDGIQPPVLDPAATSKITWPAAEILDGTSWQTLLTDAELASA